MNDKIINSLISTAEKSNVNQRHSCILLKSSNKSIIATGFNKYINNKDCSKTIHAEMDALYKIKNKINSNEKIDLVIIRLSKYNTELKNSKPCQHCISQFNKKYNKMISKIYYSDVNGDIISETLYTLTNTHISSGHKFRC